MDLRDTIDTAIGWLAPRLEQSRREARLRNMGLRQVQSRAEKYAAAKSTLTNDDWRPVSADVNEVIGNSQPTVRNRTYQLCRDMPSFAGVVDRLVDFYVGPGFQFQSRVQDDDGKPDNAARRKIEDCIKRAMHHRTADYGKRLHFHDLERLAARQRLTAGEYLAIVENRPDPRRYIPFSLNFIEPIRLTSALDSQAQAAAGAVVKQGVEYHAVTGEPLAYHIQDADTAHITRMPADTVWHQYRYERPGQLRGITPLAPAIMLAHYLNDMIHSELSVADMQSKWLAFVKSPDPANFQQLRAIWNDDEQQKVEELENAIIEYLRSGEEVTFSAPPRPNALLAPFSKFMHQLIAVAVGAPYEIVSGDYSGLNYTTIRGSRNDFLHLLKPWWFGHRNYLCEPWQRRVLDTAVLTGKIYLKNYWLDPWHYYRADWIAPGMESIDPLREVKARIDEIMAGLRSPQEVIMASGRDPEDVVKQIADFKRLLDEHGLTFGDVLSAGSTAATNNPAALGAKAWDGDVAKRLEDLMLDEGLTPNDIRLFLGEIEGTPQPETNHAS